MPVIGWVFEASFVLAGARYALQAGSADSAPSVIRFLIRRECRDESVFADGMNAECLVLTNFVSGDLGEHRPMVETCLKHPPDNRQYALAT